MRSRQSSVDLLANALAAIVAAALSLSLAFWTGPPPDVVPLDPADPVQRAHPLAPAVASAAAALLRTDAVRALALVNVAALAGAAFMLAMLLGRSGASAAGRIAFAVNAGLSVALCKAAAARATATEPLAYLLTAIAVYAIVSERRRVAGASAFLAVLSHWGAAAAVVFGIARDRRHGIKWRDTLLTYAPAALAVVSLYAWTFSTAAPAEASIATDRLVDAIAGVARDPLRTVAILYAVVTVAGGVTVLLAAKFLGRDLTLDAWGTYFAAVAVLAIARPGSGSLWLVAGFALPAVAALAGPMFGPSVWTRAAAWSLLGTLWTQQPWHGASAGPLLWPAAAGDARFWASCAVLAAFIVWFMRASQGGTRRDMPLIAAGALAAILMALLNDVSGLLPQENIGSFDGAVYLRMMRDGYDAGTWDTRLRPLVVFVNLPIDRLVFHDPFETFRAMNVVYAFGLGVVLAALARRYGASDAAVLALVVNVALCISTAKMFAFYPILVDLGAYFFVSAAVLAVVAGPPVAAAACVLAVVSREFGAVAVLFGLARDVRLRRGWWRTAAAYAPAVAAFVLLRRIAVAPRLEDTYGTDLTLASTAASLLSNVRIWADPFYAALWIYFALTVFGGLSVLLGVSVRCWWAGLRREPEWLAILVPIFGVTALGLGEMWRYSAFAVPALPPLWAWCVGGVRGRRAAWLLAGVTIVTLATQRPWQHMDDDLYFRDWFPYAALIDLNPADLLPQWPLWGWRFAGLAAALAATAVLARRMLPRAGGVAGLEPISRLQ